MARAGLEQQPQPAEDPDEWVEITDSTHVLREDIDWTTTKTGWEPISIWDGETVGQICVDYSGEKIKFRCRRRDLPKVEQPESDHVPDATKMISDDSLELIVHLRDQMQVLANRVAECERVVFAQQPQKTRVRLWATLDGIVWMSSNACPLRDWQELHHDSDGFYVEDQT